MNLKIYKFFDTEELTENQKVFLWFITMMFREVGWQETISMDCFDFRRILFGSRKGLLTTNAAFPKHLREYFYTKFIANERVLIGLSDSVFEWASHQPGTNAGLGVQDIKVESVHAQKLVIYLSACINNIDNLFVSEEEGGLYGLLIDKPSRYNTVGTDVRYRGADRFSFDQFFDE